MASMSNKSLGAKGSKPACICRSPWTSESESRASNSLCVLETTGMEVAASAAR